MKNLESLRSGARELRSAGAEQKNQVLIRLAGLLREREQQILLANGKDLKNLKNSNSAFRDRLELNPKRINAMIESLRQVAELADPVGEEVEKMTLKNGLKVRRIRAPLGVIFMIFESRPNVAIEAFSLAFKSSNVIILRGGRESRNTVALFYRLIEQAIREAGFNQKCFLGITNPDRKLVHKLLKNRAAIDVVVPRGGDQLIDFVVKESEIPIIKNDRGLCHVYIHEDADPDMAIRIVVNAKTQRPGVCNAMETVLVHEKRAAEVIPELARKLTNVEWLCCPKTIKILRGQKFAKKASKKSWDTEYLDLKMNCKIVPSLQAAIEHIENHSSRHSESIVTNSEVVARQFQEAVDSAAVFWNASTRFTDGFEFGLGGELGISTQKLHVRGPVGLRELTSLRWVIDGTGQIRE